MKFKKGDLVISDCGYKGIVITVYTNQIEIRVISRNGKPLSDDLRGMTMRADNHKFIRDTKLDKVLA